MKALYSILLSLLLVVSCKKTDIENKTKDSVNTSLKEKVLSYFDKKMAKVTDSAKAVIESLKNRIDWSDYETGVSSRKETQTVFRIKNVDNNQIGT